MCAEHHTHAKPHRQVPNSGKINSQLHFYINDFNYQKAMRTLIEKL